MTVPPRSAPPAPYVAPQAHSGIWHVASVLSPQHWRGPGGTGADSFRVWAAPHPKSGSFSLF